MRLCARAVAAVILAGWVLTPAMPAAAQPKRKAPLPCREHQRLTERQGQHDRRNSTNGAPIFKFETGEFWLNLHHFLYVLGRAEAKERDASREAVSGAPADAERGLATLKDDERQAWRAAVTAYANGLSKKDAIFDAPLPALTAALAQAGDAAILASPSAAVGTAAAQSAGSTAGGTAAGAGPATIDAATRATLERVAPIYRRVWWPAHRASNDAWRTATQSLVDRHGRAVLEFLTKAYGQQWPAAGYAVHLSMYANWAGAYSTDGRLLVVATNSAAGTSGLDGLESVFHEGMHQWDDEMIPTIERIARANNLTAPPRLSHALIFFTAGEAVKRVAPSHVPYADANGVWDRGMRLVKPPIVEAWKPYLDGPSLGDPNARDAAILDVLKKTPPIPPASGR
jgi:hypothetical protein